LFIYWIVTVVMIIKIITTAELSTHHKSEGRSDFGKCDWPLLCVVKQNFVLQSNSSSTVNDNTSNTLPMRPHYIYTHTNSDVQ